MVLWLRLIEDRDLGSINGLVFDCKSGWSVLSEFGLVVSEGEPILKFGF